MLDILIQNGVIYDGSGKQAFPSDVAIQAGRITAIENLPGAQAACVIDAKGKAVCPGFIDMHSHGDDVLPFLPTADSKIHQGITLEVVGNCGFSMAPLTPEMASEMDQERSFSVEAGINWESFAGFVDHLQNQGTSVNVAPLVGHGTIRRKVMGMKDTPPSDNELKVMREEVHRAMDEGALGISTGLIYTPNMYAATDEIAALAEVASSHGGIYTSHIRSEGSALMEAIDEAVTIGRIADIPVQVSHLKASGVRNWHKMPKAVEAIEKARSQGLDVSADMYAYNASNTSLSSLISGWAHVGGHETMLKRLQNPGLRKQLTSELANEMDAEGVGWDAILISDCAPMPELQGMTIMQIAEKWNLSPLDTVMDVLIKTDLIADIIEFSMTEENVALGLQQPWVSVCTDAAGRAAEGPFSIGKPHPRNYGSFPRILGYYCRELEIFSMEEAIRKMTSLPASKLGLKHRGLLTSGYAADVVVFDPLTVRDTATFKQPHQYPIGIEWVLVNGQVVIAGGEHQRTRPGVVETR